MLKSGCDSRLAKKACNAESRCEVRWKNLEYDPPRQRFLVGEKNAAHAASSNLVHDAVGFAEVALKSLAEIAAHGCRVNLPRHGRSSTRANASSMDSSVGGFVKLVDTNSPA